MDCLTERNRHQEIALTNGEATMVLEISDDGQGLPPVKECVAV